MSKTDTTTFVIELRERPEKWLSLCAAAAEMNPEALLQWIVGGYLARIGDVIDAENERWSGEGQGTDRPK